MKKIFTILSLAVLLCACNRTDLQPVADNYGYLTLSLSSDNDMSQTRAEQTVTNLADWKVNVTDGSSVNVDCKGDELAAKAFAAGDYTITVNNYADDATACAANSNWGAARYEGTNTVTVVKGVATPVTVACGTAKNARFKVVFADSFTAICNDAQGQAKDDYSLTTKGDRTLAFTKSTSSSVAYYAAAATVEYTLHYTYKGTAKNFENSFTMGAAATEKTVTITANDNGTITLTITYDDTFTAADAETITIDAATGNKVAATE